MYSLGFIGCGNMGEAMLAGALKAGWTTAEQVILHTNRAERMQELKERYPGIVLAEDNCAVAAKAKLIVLAIKPNIYETVLREVSASFTSASLVLAVAPAYSLAKLGQLVNNDQVVPVRCMPNTPAQLGLGMTGVTFLEKTEAAQREYVMGFLNSFGQAVAVSEELMPAVGSVSGSSPAFVYMMIEALIQGAIRLGIPAKDAQTFATQTVVGAARMVQETGQHPAQLRDAVCSAGGTTIVGVAVLEKTAFSGHVIEAMEQTAERFREMERLASNGAEKY